VDVTSGGRSAVRRSFVRNRGLLFFIPGVILLVAGILLIVSLQKHYLWPVIFNVVHFDRLCVPSVKMALRLVHCIGFVQMKAPVLLVLLPPPHHTITVLRPFFRDHPGEPVPEEKLLDFMVQGKINRGKHTDHPAGRHSIWTNQWPPPPSPIFYRPDALPATQPTVLKHWRLRWSKLNTNHSWMSIVPTNKLLKIITDGLLVIFQYLLIRLVW